MWGILGIFEGSASKERRKQFTGFSFEDFGEEP